VTQRKKPRHGAPERDPHHAREARKYDNPIPSREFIMDLLEREGVPMDFLQLFTTLELDGDEQREALSRRLRAMERDGQLVMNRKGGYCLVDAEDLVAGRIVGHPDGFGFLVPDEGGDDLFMGPRQMRSLWHGDRAVARVIGVDRRGRREGAVVEVLERAFTHVVGRLRLEAEVGFVMPDNKRLTHEVLIPKEQLDGAQDGQMVVVTLDRQPDRHLQPMGHVSEVLGDHLAPGMETDVAIRAHDIPAEWPDEVLTEIAKFGKTVPSRAKKDREDLRDIPLVTIDGEDSRDFDDAVYCKRTKSGWKLVVAIADVSHYVKPGSALDAEAIKRGNSVYFPDRVVPMLPEVLSNGLCSINPKVDRLCMAAEILIKDNGEQVRSRFFPAVMRSHARLTYTKVAAMVVDGDAGLCEQYAELLPHLHELYALYQALRAARELRGAIDFDTTEARFVFDEQGKVASVRTLDRNDAHKLIEECMLAANTAAARQLLRRKIPALYRNHERPSLEKLEDLRTFLHELGLKMGGGTEPTALDYAELLAKVQHRADAHMIQTVLLRSMMQAVYSNDNVGHFGLAFPAYTHFTSPIRRYPDLMVHRALKHLIADGTPDDFEYSPHELANLGEHCSMTERRADEATRDSADALKCEFMLDKVGQDFNGRVVSVTGFGLFVELEDIYITGLVHITALDRDFFHFDPVHHKLSGERTGKVYRLADSIEVTVAAVNLDDRKIDLVLAGARAGGEEQGPVRGRKKPGRGRRRAKGALQTRRGGRPDAHMQRVDMPDEQPEEHPVKVEASAEELERPKAKKSKRRGGAKKQREQQAETGREPPAPQAKEQEQPATAKRKKRRGRGKAREESVAAQPQQKAAKPARRPKREVPALLQTQPGKDAAPPASESRRKKPAQGRTAKPRYPRDEHGEVDGNRLQPPEQTAPDVDGNRVDYHPAKPKRNSSGGRKRSTSKRKPKA
jgi:ribonuclease R